jgi:hypothetical protein
MPSFVSLGLPNFLHLVPWNMCCQLLDASIIVPSIRTLMEAIALSSNDIWIIHLIASLRHVPYASMISIVNASNDDATIVDSPTASEKVRSQGQSGVVVRASSLGCEPR